MKKFFTAALGYILTASLFAGDYFLHNPGFMFVYGTLCFLVSLFLLGVSAIVFIVGAKMYNTDFNNSLSAFIKALGKKQIIYSVIFWVIILTYLIFLSPHFFVASLAIITIFSQIVFYWTVRLVKYFNDPLQKEI